MGITKLSAIGHPMSNIELRGNIYCAVLIVPKDVREILGRHKFRQTLATGDRREAERRAAYFVTVWKNQIEKARGNKGALSYDLLRWQSMFDEQAKSMEQADTNSTRAFLEAGMDELRDQFHDHLRSIPEKQADTLHGLVVGTRTLSSEHFDSWKNQLDLIPKTIDQMTRDVMALIERFTTLEEITKDDVLKLIAEIEQGGKGVATIKRVLCAYRNYWHYLQDKGIVPIDHDPFDIQRQLQGKFKRANKKKTARQAFTAAEAVNMWTMAKDYGDCQLADLIALASYTGARIEELCSLELRDISTESFTIRDAKTEAGNREVPIHSALVPLIDRLKVQSKDGYLLSGLTFNKFGDRSNAIGKRFGRLKTSAGYDKSLVFHSFRKTLITLLEQAGIPENFCCDIVGHEKGTIGYGHYSGGASLANKKEAIEKVSYPFPEGV